MTIERAEPFVSAPANGPARRICRVRGFFDALGDLVVTGPTLTTVNDFRVILIGGARA
jgi:hypothetical protein